MVLKILSLVLDIKKNNYRICKSKPLVVHNDFRDFSIYLKKIYYLGFYSMKYLDKIKPNGCKIQ